MKVSRRRFVSNSSLILSLFLIAANELKIGTNAARGASPDLKDRASMKKVIIVGAGMAGLAAARTLHDSGAVEVLLLEARDRIGGRICTERQKLCVPVDLGASWIHGRGKNPIYEFALAHNIELKQTDNRMQPATYASDGCRLSEEQRDALDRRFRGIIDAVYELQERREKDAPASVRAAFQKIMQEQKVLAHELENINHLIAAEVENDYATTVEDLSFQNWDQLRWFKGGDFLIPQGYDQLINLLADGLSIKLNAVISSISYADLGVKIGTVGGGMFDADAVIVTLPLGVLQSKKVSFSPELPLRKLEALQSLKMGTFDKVYLKFDHVFWTEDATWIEYVSQPPQLWSMFFNLHKALNEPILVALNTGEAALRLESASDAEIISRALLVLRKLYGSDIPEPLAWEITRWSKDPFSCGAYSHIPVGGNARALDVLGEPVGNSLFFAGEATSSKDYASVHAAFLSGLRAANALLRI